MEPVHAAGIPQAELGGGRSASRCSPNTRSPPASPPKPKQPASPPPAAQHGRVRALPGQEQARVRRYDQGLAAGWPIATGVIEGACRRLIGDRLDISEPDGAWTAPKPSSPCRRHDQQRRLRGVLARFTSAASTSSSTPARRGPVHARGVTTPLTRNRAPPFTDSCLGRGTRRSQLLSVTGWIGLVRGGLAAVDVRISRGVSAFTPTSRRAYSTAGDGDQSPLRVGGLPHFDQMTVGIADVSSASRTGAVSAA